MTRQQQIPQEVAATRVASFIKEIPHEERSELELQLASFVVQHATHHRPIALVSSGGTAADLEINAVRMLDNFSTGLRGAISVEEFLRRGYAVIHLWRTGSASPYARVLGQALGLKQANHGLSFDALGKLFAGDASMDRDQEDYLVQQVLAQESDPWLTDTTSNHNAVGRDARDVDSGLSLHRHLLYSTKLQKAIKERSQVIKEQRLLTVPFRTIEDYLARLQLSAQALQDSKSLAIMYLAAAVSDYYVPAEEKSQHKIQSQEGGNEEGLTLRLSPVPKTMGLISGEWAPDAFLVGFKLETDELVLRRKAEASVLKYGCHMVIGNLLQTRHQNVWILFPDEQQSKATVKEWPLHEISKPPQQHYAASEAQDSLESAIIDFVVQAHFEYISNSGYAEQGAGLESAMKRQADLEQKRRSLSRQAFMNQMKGHAATIAGTVIAVVLSSMINSALQRRAVGWRFSCEKAIVQIDLVK